MSDLLLSILLLGKLGEESRKKAERVLEDDISFATALLRDLCSFRATTTIHQTRCVNFMPTESPTILLTDVQMSLHPTEFRLFPPSLANSLHDSSKSKTSRAIAAVTRKFHFVHSRSRHSEACRPRPRSQSAKEVNEERGKTESEARISAERKTKDFHLRAGRRDKKGTTSTVPSKGQRNQGLYHSN